MSGVLVVTGTDTGVGKTVVAAGLAAALDAYYWKPVQAGTEESTDSETALALGVPQDRIIPEAYRLALPASPHRAAAQERVAIDSAALALPSERPLIVEGAGGLMVPLSLDPALTFLDQMSVWNAPVVLVSRTSLGTINHSLLSLAALRSRGVRVAGLVFVGKDDPQNIEAIVRLGATTSLGRLHMLDPLEGATLRRAVAANLHLATLRRIMELSA